MAGDWIKLEHVTPDKPEVVSVSSLLGIDQDAVVGKLCRIWIWADQQSITGNDLSVTDQFLDRITSAPGFANALRQVGWLSGRDGRLTIPNFALHNGQTAKSRAVTARRVARHRHATVEPCNGVVTPEALQKALPEKRREENDISPPEPKPTKLKIPPTIETVTLLFAKAAMPEIEAVKFWNFYESKGWKVGKTKMQSLAGAVGGWVARLRENKPDAKQLTKEQILKASLH